MLAWKGNDNPLAKMNPAPGGGGTVRDEFLQ